jgi:phosphoglycolate phosphatase-like HAD superfamily hydrolase
MDYQSELRDLIPSKQFFIGIDSDGCVFDTMEIKQKEFFIPNAIRVFDLAGIEGIIRETWEFVNLYSVHRGVNRFPALVKVFEMAGRRREIMDSPVKLPDLSALRQWISRETRLSNSTLKKYCESNPDPGLEKILLWSETVNEDISRRLKGVTPFPNAVKAIEKLCDYADPIVVSQTPLEALEREWKEHNIRHHVIIIAGQEHGTKAEHLALAAKGKYPDEKILLIGDAFGDLDAALSNGVLFYPVIPGKEDLSWKQFYDDGLEKFLSRTFAGSYQDRLLEAFRRSLPEIPYWEANG